MTIAAFHHTSRAVFFFLYYYYSFRPFFYYFEKRISKMTAIVATPEESHQIGRRAIYT
jgi:hypothetical protein